MFIPKPGEGPEGVQRRSQAAQSQMRSKGIDPSRFGWGLPQQGGQPQSAAAPSGQLGSMTPSKPGPDRPSAPMQPQGMAPPKPAVPMPQYGQPGGGTTNRFDGAGWASDGTRIPAGGRAQPRQSPYANSTPYAQPRAPVELADPRIAEAGIMAGAGGYRQPPNGPASPQVFNRYGPGTSPEYMQQNPDTEPFNPAATPYGQQPPAWMPDPGLRPLATQGPAGQPMGLPGPMSRPAPFQSTTRNFDGTTSQMPNFQQRDAFIAQINNQLGQMQNQSWQRPGMGAPQFDFPTMWGQAGEMAQQGFQNPFAAQDPGNQIRRLLGPAPVLKAPGSPGDQSPRPDPSVLPDDKAGSAWQARIDNYQEQLRRVPERRADQRASLEADLRKQLAWAEAGKRQEDAYVEAGRGYDIGSPASRDRLQAAIDGARQPNRRPSAPPAAAPSQPAPRQSGAGRPHLPVAGGPRRPAPTQPAGRLVSQAALADIAPEYVGRPLPPPPPGVYY